MTRARLIAIAMALGACGAAHAEPVVADAPAEQTVASEETALERACFTGSVENGVCEIFSAALEPLPALSSHCRAAGGQWMNTCPTEGRAGACRGDGRRSVYYGAGLGQEALRHACEQEGHVFEP